MKLRTTMAAFALAALLPTTVVACGADDATTLTTSSSSATGSTGTTGTAGEPPAGGPGGEGGPGGVDPSSVTTEEELVALIQSAYGEAQLGLHRGHQPVQDVLDEVLTISHDELHVRMEEQGQNLATVAEDIGVDPQALVDALVESWSPAIDDLLEAGTITEEEADGYREALEEAFTFKVTWDGSEETPTFSGLEA
ncbi:hypothetical protein [Nocardioides sp. SYSU DS0663]|uniref:hypothetical protein n=1 Tax=Nocardioides sp. SYSU DS0663 TaxID=3416445 RepID=UPI003F4C9A6B